MSRYVIRGAIAFFWLGMLGWLVAREVILPQMRTLPPAPAATMPADYWMGIYLSETERAGFVNVRTHPALRDNRNGVDMALTARMKLNLFSFNADMVITGDSWLADDRASAEFDYTLRAGDSESRVTGTLKDGTLNASLTAAGVETPFTFPISDQMLLNTGLGSPAMELPLLEPAQEAFIDSFDPSTMSVSKARLYCEGRETITAAGQTYDTSVITITIGGITTKVWVSAEQETIKVQTPFGLTLLKITTEEALTPVQPGERMTLLNTLSVKSIGAPVTRDLTRMKFRVTGLPEGMALPVDSWQQDAGEGALLIAPPANADAIPKEELNANARAEALAADPLVATNDPGIQAAAQEAVKGATTEWEKAQALHDWVFKNVRKIPTLSLPTAVDVLRTTQGDCNEHTVLYTAMARSVGIPCRMAIGLVYSEEVEGFGYHAWPEVYVNGGWVAIDPTLGQPIADATHIKILNGSIDKWGAVAGYIGKIGIEVLEAGTENGSS